MNLALHKASWVFIHSSNRELSFGLGGATGLHDLDGDPKPRFVAAPTALKDITGIHRHRCMNGWAVRNKFHSAVNRTRNNATAKGSQNLQNDSPKKWGFCPQMHQIGNVEGKTYSKPVGFGYQISPHLRPDEMDGQSNISLIQPTTFKLRLLCPWSLRPLEGAVPPVPVVFLKTWSRWFARKYVGCPETGDLTGKVMIIRGT